MHFGKFFQHGGGCPGSSMRQWQTPPSEPSTEESQPTAASVPSELRQWPVQLMLVPPEAPYFKNADLLIAADCVPFAYGNFHKEFLQGRAIVIGCPKLDNLQFYVDKLTQIFAANSLRSIEVLLMEVPCCGGLAQAAKAALERAGVSVPFKVTTIGVRGEHFGSQAL